MASCTDQWLLGISLIVVVIVMSSDALLMYYLTFNNHRKDTSCCEQLYVIVRVQSCLLPGVVGKPLNVWHPRFKESMRTRLRYIHIHTLAGL